MKQHDRRSSRSKPQAAFTRPALLAVARELKAKHGEALTLDLFRRKTKIPRRVIEELFGTWQKLRRELDLKPCSRKPRRRQFSRAALLRHLKQLSRDRESITLWEFCKEMKISQWLIHDRFRSWKNMREQAGLSRNPHRPPTYSENDILADLMQVYRKAGRCPQYHEHKRWGGKISPSTINARYGCWLGVRIRFELHLRELGLSREPPPRPPGLRALPLVPRRTPRPPLSLAALRQRARR